MVPENSSTVCAVICIEFYQFFVLLHSALYLRSCPLFKVSRNILYISRQKNGIMRLLSWPLHHFTSLGQIFLLAWIFTNDSFIFKHESAKIINFVSCQSLTHCKLNRLFSNKTSLGEKAIKKMCWFIPKENAKRFIEFEFILNTKLQTNINYQTAETKVGITRNRVKYMIYRIRLYTEGSPWHSKIHEMEWEYCFQSSCVFN